MAKLTFEKHLQDVFALVKQHKSLFGSSIPEIEIPPGWLDIVKEFLESCEDLVNAIDVDHITNVCIINQIKTKSGALHINAIIKDASNIWIAAKINGLVVKAIEQSYVRCRICGKPAKIRELNLGKYVSTQVRCDKHLKDIDIFKNFPAPFLKTSFDDMMEKLFSKS